MSFWVGPTTFSQAPAVWRPVQKEVRRSLCSQICQEFRDNCSIFTDKEMVASAEMGLAHQKFQVSYDLNPFASFAQGSYTFGLLSHTFSAPEVSPSSS